MLDSNLLYSTIPTSLLSMSSIQTLSLMNNTFSGTNSHSHTHTHAHSLMPRAITSNRSNSNRPNERTACHLLCAGVIPTSLTKMTTLQSLNLGTNRLTGTVPSSFLQIQGLLFLALDNNTLYDANAAPKPHSLTHSLTHSLIHSLARIDAWPTRSYGTIPTELGMLTRLQTLKLNTNQLSCTPGPQHSHQHTLSHSLADVLATASLPTELLQLSNARVLLLDSNFFTGSLLPFGSLPQLQILHLNQNKFTGTGTCHSRPAALSFAG